MLTLGGLGFLLACVFGSYIMQPAAAIGPLVGAMPFELLTILRRCPRHLRHGQFSMHDVKHTLGAVQA